jgi:MFS family permease
MIAPLSPLARWGVLATAILALLFDGVELGLMPVASLSVSKSLLGGAYTPTLGGDWFARFTAALMLGAAVGGIVLGGLGDRIGRTRALGVSVLFYSIFAGLGAFVETQGQMLVLRFLVGLGVGGVWPNAVALAAECWPDKSRPMIAGLMGAALNGGILLLSQVVRVWTLTPDSWRWLFQWGALPAALGLAALMVVPESPLWLNRRGGPSAGAPSGDTGSQRQVSVLRTLFSPPLLKTTLLGILIGSIPLVGAWSASKWMIPWADAVAGASAPGYKASAQGYWALGAVLGSFCGAQIAQSLGRRRAYAWMSLGSAVLTGVLFLGTRPLASGFLPTVFAQGFVATLFFGWLPLYLPELFPTEVRAAGSGIAYNVGRFITAAGVLAAGGLFVALGGSYPRIGAACGMVYLLGIVAIRWAPDTTGCGLIHSKTSSPSTP